MMNDKEKIGQSINTLTHSKGKSSDAVSAIINHLDTIDFLPGNNSFDISSYLDNIQRMHSELPGVNHSIADILAFLITYKFNPKFTESMLKQCSDMWMSASTKDADPHENAEYQLNDSINLLSMSDKELKLIFSHYLNSAIASITEEFYSQKIGDYFASVSKNTTLQAFFIEEIMKLYQFFIEIRKKITLEPERVSSSELHRINRNIRTLKNTVRVPKMIIDDIAEATSQKEQERIIETQFKSLIDHFSSVFGKKSGQNPGEAEMLTRQFAAIVKEQLESIRQLPAPQNNLPQPEPDSGARTEDVVEKYEKRLEAFIEQKHTETRKEVESLLETFLELRTDTGHTTQLHTPERRDEALSMNRAEISDEDEADSPMQSFEVPNLNEGGFSMMSEGKELSEEQARKIKEEYEHRQRDESGRDADDFGGYEGAANTQSPERGEYGTQSGPAAAHGGSDKIGDMPIGFEETFTILQRLIIERFDEIDEKITHLSKKIDAMEEEGRAVAHKQLEKIAASTEKAQEAAAIVKESLNGFGSVDTLAEDIRSIRDDIEYFKEEDQRLSESLEEN